MSNISNFKNNFRGGVRPNQFYVRFYAVPSVVGVGQTWLDTAMSCKAAQIPSSVVGNVDVPFLGRQLKVPGDRTFEDWTVTMFSDSTWAVRSSFERWMSHIQGHTNPYASSDEVPYGSAYVHQMGREGNVICTYVMEDVYPTNVAAIELDWGTNDSVEEFQVTFAVNNWRQDHLAEPQPNGSSGVGIDIGVRATIPGTNITLGGRGIF